MFGIIDEYCDAPVVKSIIKVVGVGGGGGNAVNYMYREGISDVTFAICNTDEQALRQSPIQTQILLGEGLGAGSKPQVARTAALEAEAEIRQMLSDGTRMVFITAGMGGGTGTGAAPVVAEIAKSLGILTVGIVTIPFTFEGRPKIFQALEGVAKMSKNVDALLMINNDKIKEIYPDLALHNAFDRSDNIVAAAARGIAEIVTISGEVNADFADVETVMRNGGVAVMNTGYGEGENRITAAINDALNSPLLSNNDIQSSKKLLVRFYYSESHPVQMREMDEIEQFMSTFQGDYELKWAYALDNTLEEKVKFTIIATAEDKSVIPDEYRVEFDKRDAVQPEGEVTDAEKEKASNNAKAAMSNWVVDLYGKGEKQRTNGPAVTLEMLYSDPEMLQKMWGESAYKRNKK